MSTWKVTTSEMMLRGILPRVLLGGACNIVSQDGLVRNVGRDGLAEWLSQKGIAFYDVQVHPDTHPRGYDWEVDGPQEKFARVCAELRVYEIRDDTQAGVTHEEILDDINHHRKTIVWINGKGIFSPIGLGDKKTLKANVELENRVGPTIFNHLLAYVSQGTQLRLEMQEMVKNSPQYITVVHGGTEDIIEAVGKALGLN